MRNPQNTADKNEVIVYLGTEKATFTPRKLPQHLDSGNTNGTETKRPYKVLDFCSFAFS